MAFVTNIRYADANDADANADAEQWARAEGLVARIPVIGGIT